MTLVDNYYPFDSGPGASATQARWRVMARALGTSGVVPGYLNSLAPSISGSVVSINTGGAFIDGFYGEITSTSPAKNVTVTGAGMVVACADPTAHTIAIFFRAGSGYVPAQPTNGQGTYEIPLALITGTTTFTLTDARQYAYGGTIPCAKLVPTAVTNSTADGWFQITSLTAALSRGALTVAGNAITIFTPGVYRVSASIMYQTANTSTPAIGRYICTVRVNNNEVMRNDFYFSPAGALPQPTCTSLFSLNRGDVVTLWGYKANGNIIAGSYANGIFTWLDVDMVSR